MAPLGASVGRSWDEGGVDGGDCGCCCDCWDLRPSDRQRRHGLNRSGKAERLAEKVFGRPCRGRQARVAESSGRANRIVKRREAEQEKYKKAALCEW